MEESQKPLQGVFEGYIKKHKSLGGLTMFNEYTKRYFVLDLGKFEMVYYKNRKKKSKPADVPIKEILALQNMDEHSQNMNMHNAREWGFEFKVITRSRTYRFNAYSWNDREVWLRAFRRLLEYK